MEALRARLYVEPVSKYPPANAVPTILIAEGLFLDYTNGGVVVRDVQKAYIDAVKSARELNNSLDGQSFSYPATMQLLQDPETIAKMITIGINPRTLEMLEDRDAFIRQAFPRKNKRNRAINRLYLAYRETGLFEPEHLEDSSL